jgi:hypothetical protein
MRTLESSPVIQIFFPGRSGRLKTDAERLEPPLGLPTRPQGESANPAVLEIDRSRRPWFVVPRIEAEKPCLFRVISGLPSRLHHRLALISLGRGDGEGGRGKPSCRTRAEPVPWVRAPRFCGKAQDTGQFPLRRPSSPPDPAETTIYSVPSASTSPSPAVRHELKRLAASR